MSDVSRSTVDARPVDVVLRTDRSARTWRRVLRRPQTIAGVVLLIALVVLAVFAPLFAKYGPDAVPPGGARLAPSSAHWFGTDQLGRDEFSRVLYGGRTSLLIGITAAAMAGVIGIAIGTLAGYRGGWVDALLMRVTEVVLVFPGIVLAGVLVIALGRGRGTVIVVLAVVLSPVVARVVRSSVLDVKHATFVEAARAVGVRPVNVVLRHVLPHALAPATVIITLSVGTSILAESTLSFLAVGITEPTASWGLMVAGGRRFLSSSPHIVLFPAGAIFLTVLAFVLLANGLRDAMDLDA
jgi:peptide/nickel transport system permease protein